MLYGKVAAKSMMPEVLNVPAKKGKQESVCEN